VSQSEPEREPELESELCHLDARDLVARIRAREVSAREVMQAFLARIEALNPAVNAICTLLPPEALLAAADAADAALARGPAPGPLHGLPMAVKDLALTRGIRSTLGSPIFASQVPAQDQLFVERLRAAGAIVIGKTNVPEFGAGSHTFNPLFGVTRNPWDLARSAGGSSGGAAAALAARMLPLADGSDLGGSLRNPASFCNAVGLRPSPGRVPTWPALDAWGSLGVEGPMARSAADCALLLSVMAGPDPRAPLSIDEPGERFRAPLARDWRGTRVAWTPDLGGLPVEARVRRVCESALPVFTALGLEVEPACPDLRGAMETFQVLRAHAFALALGPLLPKLGHLMKDTVRWNIEKGLALSGADVARAARERTQLYHRVRVFLEDHAFLMLPVSQVAPFDASLDWVREIEGIPMPTYVDWMATCCVITLTGLPAISVPAGFTEEGLPVGLQVVGRHRADFEVLALAHAFESATRFGARRPPLGPR
jgi:amidase